MKPLASLSLDLDNKWSYMKTHGDAGWEALPSYLDACVPRNGWQQPRIAANAPT